MKLVSHPYIVSVAAVIQNKLYALFVFFSGRARFSGFSSAFHGRPLSAVRDSRKRGRQIEQFLCVFASFDLTLCGRVNICISDTTVYLLIVFVIFRVLKSSWKYPYTYLQNRTLCRATRTNVY